MKASELRIGNLVMVRGVQTEVDLISSEGVNHFHDEGLGGENFEDEGSGRREDVQPIPLTEEWLEKFGFVSKYKSCHSRWTVNGFSIEQAQDEDDFGNEIEEREEFHYNWKVDVKHVHQLQNLYFALTEEELTIK
jgi:hypothetical protein